MHRLTDGIVAAERERNITDTTTHFRARQVFFDPSGGFKEVNRIIVVLLDPGSYGKDVGIKNDVLWIEIELSCEQIVTPLTNINATLIGIGLTMLVKRHDNNCRAISLDLFRLR